MKKNIIIAILIFLASTLLAANSTLTMAHRNRNVKTTNFIRAIQPLTANPSTENITKTLQLFGAGRSQFAIRANTVSADDKTRRQLCGTILEIAENALDTIIDPYASDEEIEEAAETFLDQAVDWVIWDCNRFL